MRVRPKQIFLLLFSAFAHCTAANADDVMLADAGMDLLALRMDKTFTAINSTEDGTPSFAEADQLAGKKDDQIELSGNVKLRKRGQSIAADHLLYSQNTQEVDASGSVVLEQNNSTVSGPHLMLNLETHIGAMEQPAFHFADNSGRGTADVLQIHDKLHYTLDNATYTTCPADKQDWQLKTRRLELDRDRQIGVARHTWVEFMDVPILYSPWMDFPIGEQRKSGFLSPMFGNTTKGGRELTLPYYLNIAPNRDVTIAPRIMSSRGLMLNNELRYLENAYHGVLHVDVLPDDTLADRSRGRFSLRHDQVLADGLKGHINFNRVSDNNYFRDLGGSVNVTSQVNMLQEGALTYSADWWNASMRAQQYQTLQDPLAPIAVPYARLPQLIFSGQRSVSNANIALAGEYVDFSHPTAPNGQRLIFNPSISYPLISDPAFYLTPKAGLHATHYTMGANNTSALPGASRVLPILSLDSGTAFERDWKTLDGNYLHTLEPRVFYVYVPYRQQDNLPVFDSAQAPFSFAQIFSENRFFGGDRVGDANHVTLALISRLLDSENGVERLKLSVSERFSFETPRVNLVAPTTTTNKSDILLAASGQATRAWSFNSELQYSPAESRTQRYNISARYRPEVGKVLNLGYRYATNSTSALIPGALVPTGNTIIDGVTYPTTNGVAYTTVGGNHYTVTSGALRQMDLSTQWPLLNRWHAVGRWNYSIKDSRILEAIAGLEYNQSCWALRLIAQRFTVGTQQVNTGFFLQLELNDLVRIGSDPLSLLKRSILGYTKLNEKPESRSLQQILR